MKVSREIQIYRRYIGKPKGVTMQDIANEYGITKAGIYYIVNKIEKGDEKKINKCTENSRQSCLWEHKYKRRYEAIPKNRKADTIILIKKLVSDMISDGFKISLVAKFLNKDRTTIIHHMK